MLQNAQVISYNIPIIYRRGERPGGIKVRFKIRVVTGKRARLFDAFDLQILWNKPGRQATVHAEITEATLRALPALLNPGQDGYDDTVGITSSETTDVEDLFESPIDPFGSPASPNPPRKTGRQYVHLSEEWQMIPAGSALRVARARSYPARAALANLRAVSARTVSWHPAS